jgi:hypothetical protein
MQERREQPYLALLALLALLASLTSLAISCLSLPLHTLDLSVCLLSSVASLVALAAQHQIDHCTNQLALMHTQLDTI